MADIEEFPIEEFPVGEAPKKKSNYTGIFSGEHPYIEFLPNRAENPVKPHEMQVVTGVDEGFDKLRQYLSDKASQLGAAGPYVSMAGSLATEPFRVAADVINDPTNLGIGLSGALGNLRNLIKPNEVPPTAIQRPIRGLLPAAGETTRPPSFVAGPAENPTGWVAPYNAPPEVDAMLQGYDLGGKSTTPAPSVLDTEALKEQERLKSIFYTGHEQGGGTSLEIPNRPPMESPALPGETKLGFNKVAEPIEEYPLNIAPEQVRPRQTQTVMEAHVPDRFKEPVIETPKTKLEPAAPLEEFTATGEPIKPAFYTGEGTARPGIESLPSAQVTIKKAAQNANVDNAVLEDTIARGPEPIAKAAAKLANEESKRPSLWKSVYTQLKDLSPDLYYRSARSVHKTRQMESQWIPQFENATRKLSKTERLNFGAYVEGKLPIENPNVQNAVDIWRDVESIIGDTATQKGLRLYTKGKEWIPFQKNTQNYWPHIPTKNLQKGDFVQKLINSGMTRSEAERVVKNFQKTGEIVVGPQYAREVGKNFPYRLDVDSGLMHIRSMAKRIAQHDEFGPLDINGKGTEGISDIIEATKDPKLANTLMERIIGREERPDPNLQKWLDRSRKYASITKLQNFTIPNMILGQGPSSLKASTHPYEALKEVAQLLKKNYRSDLAESGIWQNFSHTLAEEVSHFDPYLIGTGETFNRGIAGAIGKAMAKQYFNDLKINPNNKVALKELPELVLEPIEKILSQSSLSNNQLNLAAGRAAEMTQGLSVPGNLPYWASNPVTGKQPLNLVGQLAMTFKKMGYQITKSVWDSMKANPKVNVPLWIALSQIGGELTGDVKSGMKGAWLGDPEGEIAKRGDWWLQGSGISPTAINMVAQASGTSPELIARMIDNATQYFFLGIPADMMQSTGYGPSGLLSAAAGPVLSDISKFGNYIATGNLRQIAREGIAALPIPGSRGLAEALIPKKSQP